MARIVITNLEEFEKELIEFINKRLQVFGFLIVAEIQNLIEEIPLFVSGEFWRRVNSHVDHEGLHIESDVSYGIYLEYGTYGYFDIFGIDSFPTIIHPKKKDMSAAFKAMFPKGMQGFAPFRRVLFNTSLMGELWNKAINAPSA